MNGYQRTVAFVNSEAVDRPPFMPLVIDWAAKQYGAEYFAFVGNPALRADVHLEIANRYDIDCILPDADFYEQLADFGMALTVQNGRYSGKTFLHNPRRDAANLSPPSRKKGTRMGNRLEALRRIADAVKGEKYIFGICVGPFTEYCNARGVQAAMMDMLQDEEAAMACVNRFHDNGMDFLNAQLECGADGIQIVEPCCSLIAPALYARLIQPLHAQMVASVQKGGGFARLHICGDTNRLLPHILATGSRIVDVDAAVCMDKAARLLSPGQVLCGNLDPVSVVAEGTPQRIAQAVQDVNRLTHARAIISGGCDIPAETSAANMRAFHDACAALIMREG